MKNYLINLMQNVDLHFWDTINNIVTCKLKKIEDYYYEEKEYF